ncbi:acyltransferase family protein [Sagittula sp. SSi028]|uniref:acyltransferase family protein n=1 Tax=Sagittula sp. SSi028 TaxID=3400636 RepID=UPI003AF639DF
MTDRTFETTESRGRIEAHSAPEVKANLFGIQMLRALAAIGVLVHHALETSNGLPGEMRMVPDWLTTSGASGVDIFFVISGFIMVYVGFRGSEPKVRPRTFLLHRALRIYPIYWLCCLAILGVTAVGFLSNLDTSSEAVLRSFLLVPNDAHVLGVAWTLVYEMYFYLLFAATLLFRSRRITVFLCAVLLVLGHLAAPLAVDPVVQRFLANPIVFEFALGMGLALAFANGRLPVVPVVMGLPTLLLLFVAPIFMPHEGTHGLEGWGRVLAWGLPSALLLASVLYVARPVSRFGRLVVLLGDASYALYLTHVFVVIGYSFLLKKGVFDGMPQLVSVGLVCLLSLGVAVMAHLYVEKPLTALLRGPRRASVAG